MAIQLATNICNILETVIVKGVFKSSDNQDKNKNKLSNIYVFAFIWGVGGALDSDYHQAVT